MFLRVFTKTYSEQTIVWPQNRPIFLCNSRTKRPANLAFGMVLLLYPLCILDQTGQDYSFLAFILREISGTPTQVWPTCINKSVSKVSKVKFQSRHWQKRVTCSQERLLRVTSSVYIDQLFLFWSEYTTKFDGIKGTSQKPWTSLDGIATSLLGRTMRSRHCCLTILSTTARVGVGQTTLLPWVVTVSGVRQCDCIWGRPVIASHGTGQIQPMNWSSSWKTTQRRYCEPLPQPRLYSSSRL